MKRVRAYAYGRPFGGHNFEFFVPEDITDGQIRKEIKKRYKCYTSFGTDDRALLISFETEDGYEEVTETITRYEKKK